MFCEGFIIIMAKRKSPIEKAIAKERAGAFRQRVQPKFIPQEVRQTQVQLSQTQSILNGMFGGGVGKRVLGDVRPRINRTLQGGDKPFGLIKNQDQGETGNLFLPRGRRTGRIA